MARFQIGVDVDINDRAIARFVQSAESQLARITSQTSRGAPRTSAQGAPAALQGFQARQETEILRQARSGGLTNEQVVSARRAVRQMVDQARLAMEQQFGQPIRLDQRVIQQRVREALRTGGEVAGAVFDPEAGNNNARRAAVRAANQARTTPGTQGGDPNLPRGSGRVNEEALAETENLLRRGGTELARILDLIARDILASREVGLRAGREFEQQWAQGEVTRRSGGQETQTDVHTDLEALRQRRAVTERLAIERQRASDDQLEAATATLADLRRRRAAREATRRLDFDIGPDTAAADARTERVRRLSERRFGLTPTDNATAIERDAAVAAARARQRLTRDTIRLNTATNEDLRATNENIKAKRDHARRLAADRDAQLGGGTLTQRIQASLHNRTGQAPRPAAEFQTAGQLVGGSMLTTARFALSGSLVYGAVTGVRDLLREIEQLNLALIGVKDQMVETGRGDEFAGFRREILGIARDTGVTADEVANVGAQMVGAFHDTQRAIEETRGAFRVSVVTGLPQAELTDSLTAIAIAYDTTIESIGDKAVGLQRRTGVLARETLKVFGDIGATAKESGLSLDELGALAATIQQRSGRSGSSIAEGLGRVLPSLQERAQDILRLYRVTPALGDGAEKIAGAFREGRTGDVLLQLIRDYDKLSASQRQYLTTLLGGRREAQLLNPLFAGRADILKEVARSESDAGAVSDRYGKIQESLRQTLSRLHEELIQIGQGLTELGVFGAMQMMAKGALIAVQAVGAFVRILTRLNEMAGGVPGTLLTIVLGVRALATALTLLSTLRLGGGILAALLGGGGATGGAASTMLGLLGFGGGAAAGAGAATGGGRLASMLGLGTLASIGGRGLLGTTGGTAFGLTGTGLGIATGAVGGATYVAVRHDLNQLNKLRREQTEAAKINKDAFDRQTLRQLESNKDLYGDARSGIFDRRAAGKPWSPSAWRDSIEGLGATLTGSTTGREQINAEIADRTKRELEAAINAGYFSSYTKAEIQDLKKQVDKHGGRGRSGQEARRMLNRLNEQQRSQVEDVIRGGDTRDRNAANGGVEQVRDAQQLTQAFQSGQIGFNRLVAGLRDELSALRAIDSGADPDVHQKVLDLENQIAATLAQRAANAATFVTQLRQLAGQDITAGIPDLLAALRDPAIRRDPAAMGTIAQSVAQTQRQGLDQAIQNAGSASEALTIARQGVTLDPTARQAILDFQKQQYGRILFDPGQLRADESTIRQLQARAVQETLTSRHAREGVQTTGADQAFQALRDARYVLDNSRPGTDTDAARVAYNDARDRYSQSVFDEAQAVRRSHAGAVQDPGARAAAEMRIARRDLDRARQRGDRAGIAAADAAYQQARQQFYESQAEVAAAEADLAAARGGDDPVATARNQLADADRALATARQTGAGRAAEARAEAARIRAQRGVQQAIDDLANAQLDVVSAMAEAAGSTVQVARLQLKKAQDSLAQARRRGAGPEELARLQVDVISQTASLATSQRQDRIGDLEWMFEQDKITADAFIKGLQAELVQIPETNKDARREIERRIKAIRDQMGTDMQWNLPSELKLPTLYEARRLATVGGDMSSYQDNRDIRIVLNATNAIDGQAAVDDIVDAITAPPRVGTRPRLY